MIRPKFEPDKWRKQLTVTSDGDTREETLRKVARSWEYLYHERDKVWSDNEVLLTSIYELLMDYGCNCKCDCSSGEHSDTCVRCFACHVADLFNDCGR
jgi:hypothetical protein